MRPPPESLMPITGQPIFAARSIILTIFSPMTSPSEPPKTVKSCEKTHTRRPSIVPWPVTTASPQGRFFCMSKSLVRCRTYVSSSWKEPGSRSFSIRSRAVYFPFACCFSTAFAEAWWIAASRSSWSWSSLSAFFSRAFSRIARRSLCAAPWAHLQRDRRAHAVRVAHDHEDVLPARRLRAPEAAPDAERALAQLGRDGARSRGQCEGELAVAGQLRGPRGGA